MKYNNKIKQVYGAIIGDIVGSRYEFHPVKTTTFPWFVKEKDDLRTTEFPRPASKFTDDTVLTVAVMKTCLDLFERRTDEEILGKLGLFKDTLIKNMRRFCKKYPNRGYGRMFKKWLAMKEPIPYNSLGNGSAMRVSACGYLSNDLRIVEALAYASAEVTHNHKEGIKGATVTAKMIALARTHNNIQDVLKVGKEAYTLPDDLNEFRKTYRMDETCGGTMPATIKCLEDSDSYESCINLCVSLGGDADTMGAIAGSIASCLYEIPDMMFEDALYFIPKEFQKIINAFAERFNK